MNVRAIKERLITPFSRTRSSSAARFPGGSHWLRIAGLLLVALFAVDPILRAASSPEITGKVDRLIDVSGIGHATRQILPGILSGIDEPQQGVPASVRAALRDAAAQSFQPDPMIEKIRARLASALTARQLDDTLGWLDTPLGSRITALENEASEPAALDRMQAYARELRQRPASKRRTALVGELNAATGAGELTAAMTEAGVLASALGVNAAQPAQQRLPADVLRQQVKANLPRLRQQSDQMVTLSLLYAYRALSDQELEAYLKFLKSPSGVAYSKGAVAAFREAMLEAIGRFMLAIPKALDKHKGTVGV